MSNLLVCHSRCGSTSLMNAIINNTDKNVQWGVKDGKPWTMRDLTRTNYYFARCMVHDHSMEDLKYIASNFSCTLLYREHSPSVALSLCIGDLTGVWQIEQADESFHTKKLKIDYGHYLDKLDHARQSKDKIKHLRDEYGLMAIRYRDIYESTYIMKKILSDMNLMHGLSLDVDGAYESIRTSKKLNNYINIENMEEVWEWMRETQ